MKPVALLVALLSTSCGSPTIPTDPPAEVALYVMSSIRIEPLDGGLASGLDLDGMDSTGGATCADVADHTSTRDPSERGIDNAFALLVPQVGTWLADACLAGVDATSCLQQVLANEITSGDLLVVVEVRNIESYSHDDEIEVVLHRAAFVEEPWLIDGMLAPGQMFALEPLATAIEASIEDRILRARFEGVVTLELGTDEVTLPLVLEDVRLEAAITLTTLTNGLLSGGLDLASIPPVGSCPIMPPCTEGGSILESIADLAPRPESPDRCTQMSTVLDFRAVDAAR